MVQNKSFAFQTQDATEMISVRALFLPTTLTCECASARLLSLRLHHTLGLDLSSHTRRTPSLLRLTKPRPIRPPRTLGVRAAMTESKGVELGMRAPDFQLPEPLTGKIWKLDDFESHPALLVMFVCNHCPFVIHLKKDIVKLANFYMEKGLAVVSISSNSVETHPQDGPEFMAEEARTYKYPFPYLYD
ncbi:hypothetical protein Syun_013936 [Stephania yunnanensis]|uniref:Thioredoxin domain-containing protein n=1 Tax=Stephania yunnanensis TaxID=152371 RepID=A0AAP0PBE8_9MAGN